jgi:predicted HTH domain antitoxin
MRVTVEISDELIQQPDPGRAALEALAIEAYRSEALSAFEASRLLGLSRFEFEAFLKKHQIMDHAYGVDDWACDLVTVSKNQAARKSAAP